MSMARFNEEEVSALEAGGNEVHMHILPVKRNMHILLVNHPLIRG